MIEKAQICQFLHVSTCGWPKYHLFRFTIVVYIDFDAIDCVSKKIHVSMLDMVFIGVIFCLKLSKSIFV